MNKYDSGILPRVKCLFYFLVVCFTFQVNAQIKVANPFLKLQYDSVVLYDYEGGKEAFLLDGKNKLNTPVIRKQVTFPKTEVAVFNKKLGQASSYGGVEAMCFDPHFGIVYYWHQKIVAYIEICLECNRFRPSLRLVAQEQQPQGKASERFYLGSGMSKTFRKYINSILVRYHFSHQIKPGWSYDQ